MIQLTNKGGSYFTDLVNAWQGPYSNEMLVLQEIQDFDTHDETLLNNKLDPQREWNPLVETCIAKFVALGLVKKVA